MIENKLENFALDANVNTFNSITFDPLSSYSSMSGLTIGSLATSQLSTIPTTQFDYIDIDSFNITNTIKYVIAGNYHEYSSFLKRKNFSSDKYKFVYNSNVLRGMKNVHGYYVGSWKQREDIADIKLAIELANL